MPKSVSASIPWQPLAEFYLPGFERVARAAVLDE
jgi:hypothetical protein